jgi:hypothetical protein
VAQAREAGDALEAGSIVHPEADSHSALAAEPKRVPFSIDRRDPALEVTGRR